MGCSRMHFCHRPRFPAPNERIANLHKFVRDFAVNQSIRLFDVGEGICHQLIVEHYLVHPRRVLLVQIHTLARKVHSTLLQQAYGLPT